MASKEKPLLEISHWPPVRSKLYIVPHSSDVVINLTAVYPGWWHRFWQKALLGFRYERVKSVEDSPSDAAEAIAEDLMDSRTPG